ncbi:MAG: DUF3108 domain-containing protein [Steroidobacteraceae bacterium]
MLLRLRVLWTKTLVASGLAAMGLAGTPAVRAEPAAPSAPAKAAKAAMLQPYKARYHVSYRGLSGGEIESSFRHGTVAGQWLYETRAYPNLFGRVAVSPQAREVSTMVITSAGVRPVSFSFNDGSESTTKDVRLNYDWTQGTATGDADGKPVSFTLAPGTQDTASVQAAMIQERLAGRKPQSFRIITGNKMRDYRYWQEGTAQIMTPYGQVETEVWANQRDGSNRVSKVWHAPSLGYVPVQAIQYRKGNPEVQMKLVKLDRK